MKSRSSHDRAIQSEINRLRSAEGAAQDKNAEGQREARDKYILPHPSSDRIREIERLAEEMRAQRSVQTCVYVFAPIDPICILEAPKEGDVVWWMDVNGDYTTDVKQAERFKKSWADKVAEGSSLICWLLKDVMEQSTLQMRRPK
jgi:hypothetical protein